MIQHRIVFLNLHHQRGGGKRESKLCPKHTFKSAAARTSHKDVSASDIIGPILARHTYKYVPSHLNPSENVQHM